MFNYIKNFFDDKKTVHETKHQEHINQSKIVSKTLGPTITMFDPYYSYVYGEERFICMTKNMDKIVEIIKKATTEHPMLSRVIRNISQKVAYNEYAFVSPTNNKDKVKKVESRFKKILKDSNYTVNSFLRDNIYNLIQFSNSFTVPYRDENTKELIQVLLVQNLGWHVHSSWGTSFSKEFRFEPEGQTNNSKIYKTNIDIWHYTFNKSSDEIYGMPLWIPVIPFLRKKKYLESITIDSYRDQSLEKTIYSIGVKKNGDISPVTPESFKSIRLNLEEYPDNDLIADVPIDVNTISKTFTSPDIILEALDKQIIAGLYTSRSQLGENGAGRQDAETQQENTETIVEDFKVEFQNHLNNTFIKEICKDLFGNADEDNEVLFTFCDSFNLKERKEKHATYLFQAGIIDLDEARAMCNLNKTIDKNKTNFSLYNQKEVSGTVQSTNNPSNQHGTTHTTKKTKKDRKEVSET